MRVFLSIPLSDVCRKEIIRIQIELRSQNLFEGTFVVPENLHITLLFFGSVSEEHHERIKLQLSTIEYPAFPLQLGPLAVNSQSHPHVIWATIDSAFLEPLFRLIEEMFPEFKQERAFNAHITLARMKRVHDKKELFSALESIPMHAVSWHVTHFHLMVSNTLPEGPVYSITGEYFLAPF